MARTLVGTLILRLQENISKGATKAASSLSNLGAAVDNLGKRGSGFSRFATSAKQLEKDLSRLGSAPWGARMQAQLERLGAGARDIQKVRTEWEKLTVSLNSQKLTVGARATAISNWRMAVIGHFTAVQAAAQKTQHSLGNLWKPAAIAAGFGTGSYFTARLGRKGLSASSEYQREQFRQDMAGIGAFDRAKLEEKALGLSKRYPSVSVTDAMALGRSAYPFMGGMGRGIEVLEAMTKSFVTLQSAKGVDAAIHEITGLVKGIDNLGKNEGAALGVKNTIDIINGITKAVQLEGRDLDAGKLFEFARRAKVAGPQLSTAFLMAAAPAMMQDMTASGFGTALSSAYKAFVIGANDSASVADIGAQAALGIRRGALFSGRKVQNKGDLVDKELFSSDPFAWVEKVLIPALQAKGVDLSNDALVTENIAKLSRNTGATGMLTRMVLQRENIRKNMEFYEKAMGLDAADKAQKRDPFVAFEGVGKSFDNLAASLGKLAMPEITTAMNNFAGGINSISQAISTADISKLNGWGAALTALGGAGAVGGAFAARGMIAMVTAGPALMQAATMLQAAALAQGAKGLPGIPEAAAKTGWTSWLLSKLPAGAAALGGVMLGGALLEGGKPTSPAGFPYRYDTWDPDAPGILRRALIAQNAKKQGQDMEAARAAGFGKISTGAFDDAGAKAKEVGELIRSSLGATVSPTVDLASIAAAKSEVEALLGLLRQVGSVASGLRGQLNSLRSAYSDYGVTP